MRLLFAYLAPFLVKIFIFLFLSFFACFVYFVAKWFSAFNLFVFFGAPGQAWCILLNERSQSWHLPVHHVTAVPCGKVTDRRERTGGWGINQLQRG